MFLALDALPIAGLGLATAVYAVRRLTRSWLWLVFPIVAVMGTRLLLNSLVPRSMSITLGYALLGVALLTPLVLLALRTQHGLWDRLAPAAALFFIALVFRAADLSAAALLPMGTHGLWHLFAAAAVYLLILFLRESPKDAGERASRHHVGLPAG